MTDQVGNELDEFVTEALRNRLLGLPLDLATLNLARGRDTGIPPLNAARRPSSPPPTATRRWRPYQNWIDFGLGLRHPESLINFVAAYGTHPTITGATTLAAKRTAAARCVADDPLDAATPADAEDFMNGTGAYADATARADAVDLWVGGLAEKQAPFGGLLGSTFNFVFETPDGEPAGRRPVLLPVPDGRAEPAGAAGGQLLRRADHAATATRRTCRPTCSPGRT